MSWYPGDDISDAEARLLLRSYNFYPETDYESDVVVPGRRMAEWGDTARTVPKRRRRTEDDVAASGRRTPEWGDSSKHDDRKDGSERKEDSSKDESKDDDRNSFRHI